MRVLNFTRRDATENFRLSQGATLEELWAEAEQHGAVEVRREFGGRRYEVSIQFRLKSGSYVIAKGIHSDFRDALGRATSEAITLGASRDSGA